MTSALNIHAYVCEHTHINTSYPCPFCQSSEKVQSWRSNIWKDRAGFRGQILTSLAVKSHCHCSWLCAALLTAQLPINLPSMGIIVLVRWNVGRVCVWPVIASLQCGSKCLASLWEVCVAVPHFACTHTDPWGSWWGFELYTVFIIRFKRRRMLIK